ncbi:MAG: class I SAM-dependent methyltransferase [Eubacterium sp.]|nr:class I SAM-dependent methyltransferase [Eubacterium sp.]
MLTPRLEAIAQLVLPGEVLADIGTDHGYLPVALAASGKIPRAIAADVNAKPLEKAKNCIAEAGLSDKIETRLGSGLSVLAPREAATIVVAGMGGCLIKDLLAAEAAVARLAKRLILQPMNNGAVLRRFLEENGYAIIDEVIAKEEPRVYEIIVASQGEMKITDPLDYDIGFEARKRKHPLLLDLIEL